MSLARGVVRAAFTMVLAGTACAALGQQAVDYSKSRIGFVSRQMNVPVEGEFRKFVANVRWDTARPDASLAQVDIDAASFDMGERSLNDEATSRPFLDVRSHPRAGFVSTAVKPLGAGRFEVAGRLTIKGITRDVVVPFTVKREGASHVFDGTVTIKRLDFRVGEGEWTDTRTLADEVQVKFRLVVAERP
jgi:polyisoprenoid-binding protein YceI